MDIMKLMKQASKLKQAQKEIKKAMVEHELDGVKLVITGAGEVKDFRISQELFNKGKDEVERSIHKVVDSCLNKLQNMQMEKAKEAMGGLNMPNLFG